MHGTREEMNIFQSYGELYYSYITYKVYGCQPH